MWILPLIGYAGVVIGFCFLTLAIASGLYYLSELVEEHTVPASRLLHRLIYTIISLHILLYLIDRLPFLLSLFSIISHLIYASNLRRFPLVKLTDPLFLLSCVLVGLNHWAWFAHFSDPHAMAHHAASSSSASGAGASTTASYVSTLDYEYPSFTEIASFFGLCVWLVPFALFVSLSAGENVLPTMSAPAGAAEYAPAPSSSSSSAGAGAGPSGIGGTVVGDRRRKNVGLAKALVDGAREWMGETGQVMGWWRGDKVRSF